jgi:hypothetical protein
VGTFVASVMTSLWIYEGCVDESGTQLILDTMGPSFTGGSELVPYQDRIQMVNEDHRIMTSHMPDGQGGWVCFMTAHYHRMK